MGNVTASRVEIESLGRAEIASLYNADKREAFTVLGVPTIGRDLVVIAADPNRAADFYFINLGRVTGIEEEADDPRLFSVHTSLMGEDNVWVELHPEVN